MNAKETPALQQALRFLAAVAGDRAVTFQTFDDTEAKRKDLAGILHGTLDEHAAALTGLNARGSGVFVTINETNLRGRTADDIIRVRAVFADLDGAPLEPVLSCGLAPHIIVESSPGKWHAYWLVHGLALEHFKAVQLAIAARFGGDPKVHDLPRVMRLPGFWHRKDEPFLTHIIKENLAPPYSAEQVLAEFPRASDAVAPRAQTVDINKPLGDGERTAALLTMIGTWLNQGFDDERILSGLRLWNANNTERLPDEKLCDTLTSMRRTHERKASAGTFRCTDVGNAQRLVARHGGDMHHVVEARQFIFWNNDRWEWDDDGEVMRRAKDTARSIDDEVRAASDERRPALRAWATKSEGHERLRAMIALAQSEPGVPIHLCELDRDPYLLGVSNGVLNLRSGALRVPQREDLITKRAQVEFRPEAECPTFENFLTRILPSEAVRAFMQRFAGYMLTGDISEQCFVAAYGTGSNGKSTFVEALHAGLGDYGMKTAMDTLLHKDREGVRNDLARLRGARMVSAVEIARGRRLNEQLIKELTGGDRITARFLFKEFFEFTPEFKLFIAVNHKPEIHGTDEAIWRRVVLVPFEEFIPPGERDKNLSRKLNAELPGILNWALAGCLEWQRNGLQPPDEIVAATKEYREEQDLLAGFLASWTVSKSEAKAAAGDLYRAYLLWCRDNGEQAVRQKTFGMMLKERGLRASNQRWVGKVQRVYSGVGLRDERQKELADRGHEAVQDDREI